MMRLFFSTVWQSLLHRPVAIGMTIVSIFMSVYLLIAIEHLRGQSQENFKNTVSGVDLLVGPRGSGTNLLLYSIFQIGYPSVNISWDTYEALSKHPQMDWTIPISLGDSHRGFRVIGTTEDYFKHYRYGRKQNLAFQQQGQNSHEHHDHDHEHDHVEDHQAENQANHLDFHGAVIGAYVAQKLDYQVGHEITLSHGLSEASFHHHDDHPIKIQAILEPTGTPVDKLVLVPLAVIEDIHEPASNKKSAASGESSIQSKASFSAGYLTSKQTKQQIKTPKKEEHDHHGHDHESHDDHDHGSHKTPENITAFMLGLNNKMMTFQLQHYINNYKGEALTATLPGVALTQLWQSMNIMENTLRSIAVLVLIASLIGMSATLLASMDARKQELKIFRTMGAHPRFVFAFILTEGFIITFVGIVLALAAILISIPIANQYLIQYLGMTLSFNFLSLSTGIVLIVILLASLLMSCIPAWNAYRKVLV
ncbi:ABC transporter permease [Bermanella marisrubri]|uniref:ABC3 transporter permease C-terminal domain-containing protein n=1 Tax=Bermanella marisrubri TaxID=207949 RepID=Q1N3U2_9GAMM|nr:ABC transporter permease [Bermanella marisrubri]EAT12782.1 hypothetical protein RED65_11954 [Oceanobacter sp. RED65] [Bermanella marisrubri]QIZ83108.1 ABC transporter permease [Bermanella marisrubri]